MSQRMKYSMDGWDALDELVTADREFLRARDRDSSTLNRAVDPCTAERSWGDALQAGIRAQGVR